MVCIRVEASIGGLYLSLCVWVQISEWAFFSCKVVRKLLSVREDVGFHSLSSLSPPPRLSGFPSREKGGVGDEVTVSKHGPEPQASTTFPLP